MKCLGQVAGDSKCCAVYIPLLAEARILHVSSDADLSATSLATAKKHVTTGFGIS